MKLLNLLVLIYYFTALLTFLFNAEDTNKSKEMHEYTRSFTFSENQNGPVGTVELPFFFSFFYIIAERLPNDSCYVCACVCLCVCLFSIHRPLLLNVMSACVSVSVSVCAGMHTHVSMSASESLCACLTAAFSLLLFVCLGSKLDIVDSKRVVLVQGCF